MQHAKLMDELISMKDEDLTTREQLVENGELFTCKDQYHPRMKVIHEKKNKRIKEIINHYGWPGYSLAGKEGCHAAWLIIQHAVLDPKLQQHALKLLKQAANNGEADMKMVAFLQDRLLIAEGKPQIYGTQHILNESTNKLVPYEIANSKNVNKRRAAISIEPLEERTKALNLVM